MRRLLYLFMAFVFLSGCATVPPGKKVVSPAQMEAVEDAVAQVCGGRDCEVRACWWETPMKMACNVDFDFVTTESQHRVLEVAAKNLDDDGVRADLCGEHSPQTVFVTTAVIVVAVLVLVAILRDHDAGGSPGPNFSNVDVGPSHSSDAPVQHVSASTAQTPLLPATYAFAASVPAVCSRRER